MSTVVTEMLRDNDWQYKADIPDDMWEKMQEMEETNGDYLTSGAGGSIIHLEKNVLTDSKDGTTYANYGQYISSGILKADELRTDPMKWSKAKYHGYIKNLDTQEIRKFQFNPDNFEYTRSVTYSDSISPGMAYPETQFAHGNIREFDIELFMYDPFCTGIIKEYMCFLGAFLTPETNEPNYSRPPEMLFYYGYFIRRCVLTNLGIKHEWLDEQGSPLMTRYTLTLRQVGVEE